MVVAFWLNDITVAVPNTSEVQGADYEIDATWFTAMLIVFLLNTLIVLDLYWD